MTSIVITPANAEAVLPLATLRLHCRIDGTADDALLQLWRSAALQYVEHYTGRSVGVQTRELALDAFPCRALTIPRGPVSSVVSVKYTDGDGDEETVDPGVYRLDLYSDPQRLLPVYGQAWPTARSEPGSVRVRYVAGSNTVAGAALHALLLLVSHADKNRESVITGTIASELPLGVRALLDTLTDYSR